MRNFIITRNICEPDIIKFNSLVSNFFAENKPETILTYGVNSNPVITTKGFIVFFTFTSLVMTDQTGYDTWVKEIKKDLLIIKP